MISFRMRRSYNDASKLAVIALTRYLTFLSGNLPHLENRNR